MSRAVRRRKWQQSRGKNPKAEADKRLRAIGEDVDRYRGRCLFPEDANGELCREPPSKCHVIPRGTVLNKLKDEKTGKVLEFDWGVNQWKDLLLSSGPENPVNLEDPATFEPRELGTGDACTGPFACQRHDDVFNPSLDTDDPDFGDPEVRRLAIGRAVLYATDLASRRKFLVDRWNRNKSFRSTSKQLRFRWAEERELTNKTHRRAHSAAERWGSIWQSADRGCELPEDLIDWSPFTFRSTLTFAACVFYGQATTAMVLPSGGEHHNMTMLYLRDDLEKVTEDKERLAQEASETEKTDDYGVSMINELMSRGNGVVAASPASYKELRDEDRLAIQRIIMEKLRPWEDFTKS